MATYTELNERLGIRNRRKLGCNTYLRREDGTSDLTIRFHDTDVMVFGLNGSIKLDTGGWQTVTTKLRLNDHLPTGWQVFSDKGQWYVQWVHDYSPDDGWQRDERVRYSDGMIVTEGGKVVSRESDAAFAELDVRNAEIESKINAYVRGIDAVDIAVIMQEAVDTGVAGDCWYCTMQTQGGKTVGDAFGDTDHLEQHLDERYYMASLIMNAIKSRKFSQPSFIYSVWLADANRGNIRDLKASLRLYFRKKLIGHNVRLSRAEV